MTRKDIYAIISLEIIAVLIYKVWLSFSIFAFGDAAFAFSETLKEYLYPSAWGIHGGALLWKYPLLLVYGIISQPGFSYNVVDKFTVLWPIVFIAPLSSYLLIKKITNSVFGAFVGALIFSLNTYFLSIDTQGHELLTVAFAIAPFAILAFIKLMETKKIFWATLTSLIVFIIGAYDLRSFYVVLGSLFLYVIYNQIFIEKKISLNIKQNFIGLFVFSLLVGLLSIYWLLPVAFMNSLTNNEFLSRQLFGGEFYSLQSAINLFYPFWSGSEPTWFFVQKIPIYFWLYTILAFSAVFFTKRNMHILFFAFLAALGVFLTKQEAAPLSQIYPWLYTHVPGFAAFREASKFYFLIAISYAVLIGYFAVQIKNILRGKWVYLFVGITVLFPLLNSKPMLTGEINTMFIKKSLPDDFDKLKNYVVADKEYGRVMGINLNQYYNFTTHNHPTMNALYSLAHFWGAELISYNFLDNSKTEGEKMLNYFASDEGRRLLNQSSISYVPVFIEDKQTNQNIRRDLGNNRKFFDENMNKISYLKKIDIGLDNIILFKNLESKPHIYLALEKESFKKDVAFEKVESKMISESEYRVIFKNQKKPVYLYFTELYQPSWMIHVGKFSWYDVLFKKDYFLPNDNHSQGVARFNQFYLDSNVCHSDTCELTIYFKQQSYLYLGLIVSGITLVVTIFATVYLFKKEGNEKNKS